MNLVFQALSPLPPLSPFPTPPPSPAAVTKPPPASTECAGETILWQETVGDCRYGDGTHSNYDTLSDQADKEACLESCEHDPRCHAVDMSEPFGGTCWLFENSDGSHSGDGVATSRCYIVEWSETVGDCRYLDGQHSNYETLSDQPSVDACKQACEDDARCHAFDMEYPFAGTCWLFENVGDGEHMGDGVSSSRCYIHVTHADCAAGCVDDPDGALAAVLTVQGEPDPTDCAAVLLDEGRAVLLRGHSLPWQGFPSH